MPALENKKVVIIGATRQAGIGFGIARLLLRESVSTQVVVGSSTSTRVEQAVESLNELASGTNNSASGHVVDIGDKDSVSAFMKKVGPMDHLIFTNGGALPPPADFRTQDLAPVKEWTDIRFWGLVHTIQAALPLLKDDSSITLTVGSAVYDPVKGFPLAVSIGCAMDGLARSLAVELAPIRVNAVAPGVINTGAIRFMNYEDHAKILPLKKVGTPADSAEAYLYVMRCGFLTGQRIEVDGGNRFRKVAELSLKGNQ